MAPMRELADFAWLLATHPDAAVRDGKRALELAERAIATGGAVRIRGTCRERAGGLPRGPRARAARAEAGDFEQAASEVEAAIPKLPPEAAPALRHLLEDLGKGQPVRAEPRFP